MLGLNTFLAPMAQAILPVLGLRLSRNKLMGTLRKDSFMILGKEQTTRNMVGELGGCQEVVYVFLGGHSFWEDMTHREDHQKILGQTQD